LRKREPPAGALTRSLGEGGMTRFQRILLMTIACGVIAVGIAWLILVVAR
jgi:hypothetical protein